MRILFTNNSRKMNGLPLRRKTSKKKRFYTRCKTWEDISSWYDALNN